MSEIEFLRAVAGILGHRIEDCGGDDAYYYCTEIRSHDCLPSGEDLTPEHPIPNETGIGWVRHYVLRSLERRLGCA